MRRLAFVLISCSALSAFQLNDPIPSPDKQEWATISSEISVCYIEDSCGTDSLCCILDRGDLVEPFFLSISFPCSKAALDSFFNECEKALEKEGKAKRMGLIVSGPSERAEIKQWLEKIAAAHNKMDPPSISLFGQPPVRVVQTKTDQDPQLVLSYGFNLPSIRTFREIRKLWVMKLIQEMTLLRMEHEGILPANHHGACREFLLPSSHLRIALPIDHNNGDDQNWQKSLQLGLQKIKDIAEVGFTSEELQEAKHECLGQLQSLQNNSRQAAAFQAHSYIRDLNPLSYATYIESAPSLIESITPVDVAIVMHECFSKQQRTLSYLTSQEVDSSWAEEAANIVDGVEKGENQRIALLQTELENINDSFYQLPLHDHERALIHKIVDTMARDNVIKLGLKRKTMEKKGKKIRHVHPLRFLGYVFSDPHLKHCMREISRSTFKWHGFIDGMRDRIEEEASRNGLIPHLHAFAELTHCNEEKARHYIEKRDWEKLVRHLLE